MRSTKSSTGLYLQQYKWLVRLATAWGARGLGISCAAQAACCAAALLPTMRCTATMGRGLIGCGPGFPCLQADAGGFIKLQALRLRTLGVNRHKLTQ